MEIILKTTDKKQSMSILRYLKAHGANYSTHIEDGTKFNDTSAEPILIPIYVIEIEDDDHSKNVVSDFLNLR